MTDQDIDATRPNLARVLNVLDGGKDNYAADRAEAAELLRICPQLQDMAATSRPFLKRAVAWAGGQGVTQFVDLGAGLPVPGEVHEAARALNPDARTAYVHTDPLVLVHSRVLRPGPGVATVDADLTRPAEVLASPALREVIDPATPVALIFGVAFSFMAAAQAREVVARYAALVVPGSLVALSCWHFADADLSEQLAAAFTSADLHNHAQEDLAAFLSGLELLPPGIAPAGGLRPGQPRGALALAPGLACVLAAVARKP